MSRYASGSFAFRGRIFPRGESIMEKGSEELLGVPHIVPLPRVMHEGESESQYQS